MNTLVMLMNGLELVDWQWVPDHANVTVQYPVGRERTVTELMMEGGIPDEQRWKIDQQLRNGRLLDEAAIPRVGPGLTASFRAWLR